MESSQSVEHCNSLTLSYYFVLLALLLFIFQAKALVNEDCQVLAFSFFPRKLTACFCLNRSHSDT